MHAAKMLAAKARPFARKYRRYAGPAAVALVTVAPSAAFAQSSPSGFTLPSANDYIDFAAFGKAIFALALPILSVGTGAAILFSYGSGLVKMVSRGGKRLMGAAR